MNNSFYEYPYPSKRTMIYAKNGVVASSQYLASQAGLEILKKGGNAVDAAIACAACLTVTEPTSNGIGGDSFALLWFKGKLYGLNASGPAPADIDREVLIKAGITQIPKYGWLSVTVPGCVSAWKELSQKFGKLTLRQALEPAIDYAFNGYPVSPVVSRNWYDHLENYKRDLNHPMYSEWFRTFSIEGRSPRTGELWRSPEMAQTLSSIADTGGESFYKGELAEKIVRFSQQNSGFLTLEDMEAYRPEWVDPLSVEYNGYTVWEMPPNGHGLIVLLALNILKNFDLEGCSPVQKTHYLIEALKLAFIDGLANIGDPRYSDANVNGLLAESYGSIRSKLITDRAVIPRPGLSHDGGTVYLATADQDGNMVSFIQSNYMGFGSGLVVPGTGIALHNRGCSFNLLSNHPNRLEGGKRPYHTIIPGFITQGSNAIGPFGVMGAMMQPQGHVQVVSNLLNEVLNPQASLDAPRWQWLEGNSLIVENNFPLERIQSLKKMGHNIEVSNNTASFGRGQIIWRDPQTQVYICGTEPRADSQIACW